MAGAPVAVLFDDDCGICTAGARLLRRWDRRGRLELVPFSDPRARRLTPGLSDDEFESQFHAIEDGHRVSGGAAATLVMRHLRGARLAAAIIEGSPFLSRVTDRVYRWVARNRHRISRTCGLEPRPPSPIPPQGATRGRKDP